MSDEVTRFCPTCQAQGTKAKLVPTQGQLPQSGEAHLPTTKWTCSTDRCPYTTWDASHAAWQSNDVRHPLTHERLTKVREYQGASERVPDGTTEQEKP
jgi:hypothetical protein